VAENDINLKLQKSSSVLITGGSGLIGRYLTSALLSEGYKVSHLSRNANQFGKVRVFRWDPGNKIINPVIFDGIDCIIHLAGANIGERRWSKSRKEAILNSRVDSAKFIYETITRNSIPVKSFISASAIGYYGSVTSDKIMTEEESPGNDFLGNICRQWEESADLFSGSGIRTVKIRTAIVLEKTDSALTKLMIPAKYGFVVKTGSGRQYMPWIHISDLCGIYLKAVEDKEMAGAYNAVSPQHVTHSEFMKVLADVMKCRVFFPPVPSIVIRAVLGEMSDVVLKGSRVSSQKIINAGYHFSFDNLHDALVDVLTIQ
jgi:uncharacterized protein (TIGR01777 family)